MKKIYTVVFALMVLILMTMSATADRTIQKNGIVGDTNQQTDLNGHIAPMLNANVNLNNGGTVDYKDLGILEAATGLSLAAKPGVVIPYTSVDVQTPPTWPLKPIIT